MTKQKIDWKRMRKDIERARAMIVDKIANHGLLDDLRGRVAEDLDRETARVIIPDSYELLTKPYNPDMLSDPMIRRSFSNLWFNLGNTQPAIYAHIPDLSLEYARKHGLSYEESFKLDESEERMFGSDNLRCKIAGIQTELVNRLSEEAQRQGLTRKKRFEREFSGQVYPFVYNSKNYRLD